MTSIADTTLLTTLNWTIGILFYLEGARCAWNLYAVTANHWDTYMHTRSHITPGDGDPRHGTVNGYTNLHCRCTQCRTAWATRTRNHRNRQRLTNEPSR